MASVSEETRIWLKLRRFYLAGTDGSGDEEIVAVSVSHQAGGEELKAVLRKELQLEEGLIMKLRNSRNSLIPMNGQITSNTRLTPYILEVVRPHQFVAPSGSRKQSMLYEDCMRHTFTHLQHRVSELEAHYPDCQTKRTNKINQDIHDLQQRLDFISKRFMEGDTQSWQGMFKRQPLW